MNTIVPSAAKDLMRIHKVISRGINIDLEKAMVYLHSGLPEPRELTGYASYTHSFFSVLSSHHQSEDQVVFPEFKKVLPDAPYEKLGEDHEKISSILSHFPDALANLTGDLENKGLNTIVDCLQKIKQLWGPHISIEETYFSEQALNQVMDIDTQKKLTEMASKHSQEHSEPPHWVIPFIVYNLDKEERALMVSSFHPVIMAELVPKVWKEQWEPMKPFLLT